MTRNEFDAWMAETDASRLQWREDVIYRLNGRGFMYYSGGEDGVFVRADSDGKLVAGRYEGAIPHIGEALFRPVVTKQFDNPSRAFTAMAEAGGIQFVIDMFSQSNAPSAAPSNEREGEPKDFDDIAREFAAWKYSVNENPGAWREDKRYRQHKEGAMYYIGGESGQYMHITEKGMLRLGTYELARPGFEDAVLIIRANKQYGGYEHALLAASEFAGQRFKDEIFSEKSSVVDKLRAARKSPPAPRRESAEPRKNKGDIEL